MTFVPYLLAAPLVAAIACVAARRYAAAFSVAAAVLTLTLGTLTAFAAFAAPPARGVGGLVYLDALSGLIVLIVSIVGGLATLQSVTYMRSEVSSGHVSHDQLPWFHALLQLSILAMLAVPLIANLGGMWVAIEATTLTTALLVGFLRTDHALEAAWKYLALCTVGIAVALLGIVVTYYAAGRVLGESPGALEWDVLRDNAAALDPGLMRLAFVLVLIGFGTKAGLAPMHTWLPDAHSQAPTPVSALLSGALLNCALYGIFRFHVLSAEATGASFSSDVLLVMGVISVVVAVPFILVQHDLKRLLAYSSVEHVGIVTLGVGIGGPLALFAVAFHMINHAVAKSALFFAAGAIGQRYGTLRMPRLRGTILAAPLPTLALIAGTLAISGSPPFAPFASEFGIARAGFAGRPAALAATVVLLAATAVLFGGMLHHVLRLSLRGTPHDLRSAPFPYAWAFLGVPLGALLVGGLWLPPALSDGFAAVARVLGGAR